MNADYRGSADLYGPKAVALLEELARDLPPATWAKVWDVVIEVDEACATRDEAEHRREVELVWAHLPGLAPVLELLRAHVEGYMPDCCAHPGQPEQRLLPARGGAPMTTLTEHPTYREGADLAAKAGVLGAALQADLPPELWTCVQAYAGSVAIATMTLCLAVMEYQRGVPDQPA